MKSLILYSATLCLAAGLASGKTWTGKISDSMCGATHKKMEEHGTAKISDRDCTLACVKNGGKYVFVSGGKVYQITNQDATGLSENAGATVKLTGDMTGDDIKVTSVAPAGKAKKTEKEKKSD